MPPQQAPICRNGGLTVVNCRDYMIGALKNRGKRSRALQTHGKLSARPALNFRERLRYSACCTEKLVFLFFIVVN